MATLPSRDPNTNPANTVEVYGTDGVTDWRITIANLLKNPGAIGGGTPAAGTFANLIGTLVSGSITAGFGPIDIGSSTLDVGATTITTSLVITGAGSSTSYLTGTGDTRFTIESTGGPTTDMALQFTAGLGSAETWAIGIDRSDSDAFAIAYRADGNPSLTAQRIFGISTAGLVTAIDLALSGTASVSSTLTLAAATTSISSLLIPAGAAPSSPNNGDMWAIGDDLFRRIGGVTKSITFA